MMSKKVNVAIVGLGFGTEFIPIYQNHPQANMYAICQRPEARLNSRRSVRCREAIHELRGSSLKDPEVDAVHINSPIPPTRLAKHQPL